ncbi:MAG TPA: aspartate aminotransferase family protein, partial [Conexibacter sp.]|nr:aspartate aminotransferase family protein [Conexibacter sp.]
SAVEAISRFAGGGARRIAQSADLVLARGQGSYVVSDSGARYLDVISGFGVASLGHCHPEWVEAVVAQAHRLTVTPLHTEELGRYLATLGEALPARLDRSALYSGGAEAVEAAIRLVQTASGRPGVLTFRDGFHGKTSGVRYVGDPGSPEAAVLAPPWLRSAPFPACELHDAAAYPSCEESAADALAAIAVREDLADVGAVLVEPVLGTAGNIPPRRQFLAEQRRLCDERGWLLVLDESITGFGRTGSLFASEHFGVEPDVMVLGKGLGGGFPLSAVCASGDLWASSALGGPSGTSSSYGGNPLACAAGLATLEIVTRREFLRGVRNVADHAAARLRELAAAAPEVARARGVGLMLGFDLVDPATGELAGAERCGEVFRACRDRGVLLLADVPRVRLSPPLTLARAEADELFDVLEAVLA